MVANPKHEWMNVPTVRRVSSFMGLGTHSHGYRVPTATWHLRFVVSWGTGSRTNTQSLQTCFAQKRCTPINAFDWWFLFYK